MVSVARRAHAGTWGETPVRVRATKCNVTSARTGRHRTYSRGFTRTEASHLSTSSTRTPRSLQAKLSGDPLGLYSGPWNLARKIWPWGRAPGILDLGKEIRAGQRAGLEEAGSEPGSVISKLGFSPRLDGKPKDSLLMPSDKCFPAILRFGGAAMRRSGGPTIRRFRRFRGKTGSHVSLTRHGLDPLRNPTPLASPTIEGPRRISRARPSEICQIWVALVMST